MLDVFIHLISTCIHIYLSLPQSYEPIGKWECS